MPRVTYGSGGAMVTPRIARNGRTWVVSALLSNVEATHPLDPGPQRPPGARAHRPRPDAGTVRGVVKDREGSEPQRIERRAQANVVPGRRGEQQCERRSARPGMQERRRERERSEDRRR